MATSRRLNWTPLIHLLIGVGYFVGMPRQTQRLFAQDLPSVRSSAPADSVILKNSRGGSWFVARDLKEKYDRVLEQTKALKIELDQKGLSTAEARQRISGLRTELEDLRKEIEQKKTLVTAAKIHTQRETTLFDLGPDKLLVITGDHIVVRGWDGPQVKCEFEKIVLANGDDGVAQHLAGLKLVHTHGAEPEIVGRTAQEDDADEAAFLASEAGQKATPQLLEFRKSIRRSRDATHLPYRDFQGHEFDSLHIEGLTAQEGNQMINVRIDSKGGNVRSGNEWQRHAGLTVYVPRCKAVALRGCLVGLDVRGVNAALVVTSDGSVDRDYEGTFEISELNGSLSVFNAPLDRLGSVTGNVSIVSTTELANTSTGFANDQRTLYTPPPRQLVCEKIDGDLTAWFSRVDLKLSGISGRIDVKNEFGDTALTAPAKFADQPHRIVSESGRIDVSMKLDNFRQLPFFAFTSVGTLRTPALRESLEDFNFNTWSELSSSRREWRGVRTQLKGKERFSLSTFTRPDAVLSGSERANGLDIMSKSGTIVVTVE